MKNWKHFQLLCSKFSQIAHAAKQKTKQKKRGFAVTHPRAGKQHVMTWHHNEHLHQIKVQPLREQIHHCRLCIILYRIITIEHNYLFRSTFIITKSRMIFALNGGKTKTNNKRTHLHYWPVLLAMTVQFRGRGYLEIYPSGSLLPGNISVWFRVTWRCIFLVQSYLEIYPSGSELSGDNYILLVQSPLLG